MPDRSFYVHLASLQNFAGELSTQLSGMATPVDYLSKLSTEPVLLGSFDEAHSLGECHQAAVAEMAQLLAEVRDGIAFAENITVTVANGYQQLDQDLAGGMSVAGSGVDSGSGSGGGNSQGARDQYGSDATNAATNGAVTAGYLDQPAGGGHAAPGVGSVNVSVNVNGVGVTVAEGGQKA